MPNNSGRGKQLFDINNLEQAKKLTEQMLSILNKTSSTATEYMKDGETLEKLYTQLNNISKDNLKYTNDILNSSKGRVNLLNELNTIYESINKEFNDYVDSQASINYAVQQEIEKRKQLNTLEENRQKLQNNKISLETEANKLLQDQYEKIEKIAEKEYDSMSTGKKLQVGSKDKYVSNRSKELKQTYTSEYQKLVDRTVNEAYDSGSSFTSKDLKNLSDQAFGKVTESTDKFNESLGKFDIASTAWELASKTFMAGINRVFSIFTDGLNKQSDLYEETFQNISVRTGLSSSEYINKQTNTDNQLSSMGLYDNIKVSEVQQMWQDLANTGMNQQDIFSTAIDNVVTQKIVPYLKTTSESFNLLNNRLDGKFVKDIRGINDANLQIAGANYATEDLLNDIMELVQPMSEEAIDNLAQNSTEVTSMANKLINDYGWDKQDAMDYAKSAFKYQNYGSQMFNQGSISDKMKYINILQSGLDINDLSTANDIAGISINTDRFLMDTAGANYNSTMGSFLANTAASVYGINPSTARNIVTKPVDGSKLASETDLTEDEYNNYTNNALKEFMDGKNQTLKQKQDTSIENIATNVAGIRESIGEWSVVVESLISGIGSLFATWIGGKLIGGVIGKSLGILGGSAAGGSGAGIGAALSANGLAFGAFGAAAGITLTGIISDGIINSEAKNMGKNSDYYDKTGELDKFKKYDENGDEVEMSDTAKKLLSGGLDDAGSKGWGGNISDAFNFIGEYKSNPLMGWGISREDRNKAIFAKEMNLIGAQNLSDIDTAKARTAWLLIADASGVLDDLDGWSRDGLKSAYTTIFDGDDDALYWVDRIKKWGNFYNPQMSTDAGKTTTYISPNKEWLSANYHRYGLDAVPYDGYKAVLHEGEAVLTASTANEMRDLVDEYRDTNTQIADFDVIIQGQTTAILAKMDDIISAIANKNNYTPTSSSLNSINARDERLKSSMLKMISTRQFG